MNFLEYVFFDIYPYIAGAVFIIGSWLRYDYGQYAACRVPVRCWIKGMRLASLFHVGILGIFFGHFVGVLTPHWMYEPFITVAQKQMLAMVAGGTCGVMTLNRRRSAAQTPSDQPACPCSIVCGRYSDHHPAGDRVILGLGTIPFLSAQHCGSSEMMKLVGWAQSVVTFQGCIRASLEGLPLSSACTWCWV